MSLSASPARRRGGGRLAVGVLVAVLLAAAGVGAWWWLTTDDLPGPEAAAEAVGAALASGELTGGPFGADTAAVAARHAEVVEALDGVERDVSLIALQHDPETEPDLATARYEVVWTLPGERAWATEVETALRRADPPSQGDTPPAGTVDGWRAETSAEALVHADVPDGGRLTLSRTTPTRADVLAADGTPIVTDREVVDVGIQPSRVEDLDETVDAVRDLLDLQLDDLPERIDAADPDLFVPVVTLRADAFEAVEDDLVPVPGTVFRRDTQPLAPTAEFARATLGRAGPVTAEMIEDEPERYQAADVAGLSGLQRVYDERLAGRPGLEVVAVGPEDGEDGEDGEEEPQVLFAAEPEDGEPVTVTLDEDVQRAADAALADTTGSPSALVAVRISDGHVVAVANGPGGGGGDLALTGRYPPGSTFKVVTTAALLEAGLSPQDTVPCPAQATVDGRAFTNAEDAELGDVPFVTAFAESCNTAFVALAEDLDATTLRDTAAGFGIGRDPQLGLPAFGGEVPETEPGTDQAAAAIGQGRVLVSPFAAADLAATAARGGALPPSLVLDDPPASTPETAPLDAAITQELPDLLRAVVTEGTGSAVADVPGPPVIGKTGTAEYGTDDPPRTHAWFLGSQDDLAFAVLVAETEDALGGSTAAPLAARFLTELADG